VTTDAGPGLTIRLDVPRVGMPVVTAWEHVDDDVTRLRSTGEESATGPTVRPRPPPRR
jgi:hypothetical protein